MTTDHIRHLLETQYQPRHNWDRAINWTLIAIGITAAITLAVILIA